MIELPFGVGSGKISTVGLVAHSHCRCLTRTSITR